MKLIPVVTDRNEVIYINPEKIINVRLKDSTTAKSYSKNSFEANYKEFEQETYRKKFHISLEDFGFDIYEDVWEKLKGTLVEE